MEKIARGDGGVEEEEQAGVDKRWSSNKSERQAMLQRRREMMILEARRKLEARERER